MSISIPQNDHIIIAFNQGLKFNCNICKETGEQLGCFCNKCQRSMHPSCAGVEIGTVYDANGTKQVVLPVSEKLPKSCRECLREMDGIVLMNQVFLQQRYPAQAFRSSITSPHALTLIPSVSVIELGKSHKVEEGNDDCMVHRHNPGHDIWLKDNGNYTCYGCKMDGSGPHYACSNSSCSFILHPECLLPRKTTTHSFFPKSTFLFTCSPITSYSKHGKKEHTNVFCVACGMNVKGYHYHDRNGLYNLHPCCINLTAQIICGNSGVEMVLQKECTSKCGRCHETSVKRGRSSTNHVWSYVAKNENYHLHIVCLMKLLSDWGEDLSMGRLISCNMISKKGVARMNLKIALRRAKTMCKSKFKIFVKYAKIALGAIIAALLGDATTLFVNTAVALSSE